MTKRIKKLVTKTICHTLVAAILNSNTDDLNTIESSIETCKLAIALKRGGNDYVTPTVTSIHNC